MATYSFRDTGCAISGPGGSVNMGPGTGVAEEGITVERIEDATTMSTGADGVVMHSLHAGDSGTVRIRFLKTSPTNALLMTMWNFQRLSGANHGNNTVTVRDFARGDVVSCTEVAFTGPPGISWAKAGPILEWVFQAGHVHYTLGVGAPQIAGII